MHGSLPHYPISFPVIWYKLHGQTKYIYSNTSTNIVSLGNKNTTEHNRECKIGKFGKMCFEEFNSLE